MTTRTSLKGSTLPAYPAPPKPFYAKWRTWVILAAVITVYVWAFRGIPFAGIKPTAWQITTAVFRGLFHPDWNYVYLKDGEDLLRGLGETLAIALLGTSISVVLTIPFAIWASRNLIKFRLFSGASTFTLSLIRTFPDIIMAIIFIKAVGPGAFAGVLTIGINSIGMLGKLNAEAIEDLDMGPSEALKACGANRLQTIWHAVVPLAIPAYLSFALFRLEINVRSAAILGAVGAGGIGTPLIFAMEGRSWSRVGIILLGIIVLVTAIDWLSGKLRRRLVQGKS
ncbi:phosphonate ABC transporter, permease protein PhnE [Cohnella endophytica]|uniref:Phosphonate ABC transporter, permease protein PhnE n=1 Tax=Cohnella endophytica TaxID=2419778 RepID=A0A494X1S2_9BACL|nr:phosphonate ABC transporter, permease protein PhnE [Cohnella endophytica]RKP44270.1 phosphonate ABC transporter, permease protein PhnE [Cohnella endophytica]